MPSVFCVNVGAMLSSTGGEKRGGGGGEAELMGAGYVLGFPKGAKRLLLPLPLPRSICGFLGVQRRGPFMFMVFLPRVHCFGY